MGIKTKTSFDKDKQPTKRRGKAQRTLLLEALKDAGHDEKTFYALMLSRAMNPDDQASPQLMKEVLTRLYPQAKPTLPLIEFEFPVNESATKKVEALEKAVSEATIPGDIAKMMVDIIKAGMEISEITDLRDRIEALEGALSGPSTQ